MLDGYNRSINYMRISLTDRCNLHCVYCRPDNARMLEHSDVLRYEELLDVAKCAVSLGINRFKITGGEPLLRKGSVDFMATLKALEGVEQVTLTTNGMLLEQYIPKLLSCGIDGINISLDTLDNDLYEQITGGGNIEKALRGIRSTVAVGIKCKLNCVALRILHEKDIINLVEFAHGLRVPLRFIELMPLACNNKLHSYNGNEIRSLLEEVGYKLEKVNIILGNGPAAYYEATKNGEKQIIGFIEPLHGKFCGSCNRVRLTSTGQLKPCLYSHSTLDLRQLLRSSGSKGLKNKLEQDDEEKKCSVNIENELVAAFQKAIHAKPMGHHFEDSPAGFSMNEIGG